MPWSNWSYLNYVGALLYGFWVAFYLNLYGNTPRSKERPIGQTQLSKVYWTVAK